MRLLAVFDWLEEWVEDPGFHGCLFSKAAGEYPHPDDLPRQAAEDIKATCRALLERLRAELSCPQPMAPARQLELLMEGASSVAFLRREPAAGKAARQVASVLIEAQCDRVDGPAREPRGFIPPAGPRSAP